MNKINQLRVLDCFSSDSVEDRALDLELEITEEFIEKDKIVDIRKKVCCLDLLNAICDGYIDETVSGLFFRNLDTRTCKSGVPRIKKCPFCGSKIETSKDGNSWDWYTLKENGDG